MDRKAELEKKRQRLEEIRKAKRDKEALKNQGSPVKSAGAQKEPVDLRTETDRMLQSLGIPEADPVAVSTVSSSGDATESVNQSLLSSSSSTTGSTVRSATSVTKLSVSKMAQTNIAPRDLVSYNKETQTTIEASDRDVLTYDNVTHSDDEHDLHSTSGLGSKVIPQLVAEVKHPEVKKEEEKPPVKELSQEEKELLMKSEEFMRFFDRSTRVVERALDENDRVDLFTDYTGRDQNSDYNQQAGETIKLSREFFDERWSKHRIVTCMDWSSQNPELLVASYNANEESPHEPDGVCLVWNQKYKKNTPEFIFHCHSAVMSCCFAKFHPNLVVGGTYSGQLVIWDNRSHKRTPVQRTPLSASSHTHPVYCVNVVGTQNAHNLISISNDGKLCSWSLDMLSQPQESLELQQKQFQSVAATSMSFFSGDANNFAIGSEEGLVYYGCRHGSKVGVSESYEGHYGPVTGIHTHSVPGPVDFSQYFLTSSFDWTVKLWSTKETKAVYSFENYSDYVYDVRWSPIHPALFATVDGSGRLELWNLNNDTEVPIAVEQVDSAGLFRCRWHSSGHSIAVADDAAKIHLYNIAEHASQPRADEWTRLVHTLHELPSEANTSQTATTSSLDTDTPSAIAHLLTPAR